jgi:hypothetical protein
MDAGLAAVIAAVIGAAGGIVVVVVQQVASFRSENREDHAKVMERLDVIGGKVDGVHNKLSEHLSWHVTTQGGRAHGRSTEGSKRALKRKG